MTVVNLATDEGLRAACESLGPPESWGPDGRTWMNNLTATIDRIRSAGESERSLRDFQEWLWEHNNLAAIGQGRVPVDRALDDEGFRRWFATRSMDPLPDTTEKRLSFLTSLYDDLKARLEPFLHGRVPHLKIFRVLAALYPEAMTTVASTGALDKLTRAMGSNRRLDPVARHVWVRERIDSVLPPVSEAPKGLAKRMALAWMLYARFVQAPADVTETAESGDGSKLLPLPAARRRRGLTATRGLFLGMLSTLEALREGLTRPELLDVLRSASPEAKSSSLGVTINSLQSEFAVIKADGDRYVLTERGEDLLESQDPSHLADWLLTRVLGTDKALAQLRDHGPLSSLELTTAIKAMNPGWTSHITPQAIVNWFRSMGVIDVADDKLTLTELGRRWAAQIDWEPEALPQDPNGIPPGERGGGGESEVVALPAQDDIIRAVQKKGQFSAALISQLDTGLWSHPRRHFAILTGLSGSGKTLLAREYALAVTPPGHGERLFTLPVQPGWYDPTALLGYTNPLRDDAYVRTKFLEFLLAAGSDPRHPHVVVLDEMNLSHPEQYMAPLLSAMETGEAIQLHTEGEVFDGVPSTLPYPSNLVIIGTVNMDETTHGLSDKVLDRAFVLEFWEVNLEAYPRWKRESLDSEQVTRTRNALTALMESLSPARLHFGWRVVDDVLAFLERAVGSAALPFERALDAVIYAKVLPKLRGEDAPRFREALAKTEVALASLGLSQSKDKVAELRRDLETTGSARFWR